MRLPEHIKRLQTVARPVATAASDYAAGHTIDWHDHPRAQLVYAERGVISVSTIEGVWITPPERAVWVPAGIRHRVDMSGRVRMHSLYVRPDAATGLFSQCRVVMVTPLLRELIRQAVNVPELYDEKGPDGRLIQVLVDQLVSLDQAPLHLPMPEDQRLRRVTEAIISNPADNRSLNAWARDAGASARTLERIFRRETAMTFRAWRQQARLLAALKALAGRQPVTHVALDLGYESPSAFIAMFRRAFGVSPGRYFNPPTP
ncbi:MAG: helix-turn-helix transcriptional regulator [Rhodospirillaceae bacterium]|jgi:AraC-like DNA-binding protein|nr:helix-turn-helix transcriptional regulator [Rhodospirillaceae bacterium]